MIELSQALDRMKETDRSGQPKPFDIAFVTYDKNKQKGGEKRNLKNCIRTGQKHDTTHHRTIGVKEQHDRGHPYAVHIYLITHFNGEEVFV